jgi:hypothetical protein
MKYSRYKVNCSEVVDLMSREQGVSQPSDNELIDFLKILDKKEVDITDKQIDTLQKFVLRTTTYDNYSLSASARKAIYKHYSYSEYGLSKVSNGGTNAIQLEKGSMGEPSAIELLNKLDNANYTKNEKTFSNRYFKGKPDILIMEGEKVVGIKEVKIPIDLPSFLEVFDTDAYRDDRWQVLAYLDIFDLKEAELCYCLVNMPPTIKQLRLQENEERLLRMGVAKDQISKRLKQIAASMEYDSIPEDKRVVRFKITRKSYFTKQMHQRVKVLRERMAKLHESFQKSLILDETAEPLQINIS